MGAPKLYMYMEIGETLVVGAGAIGTLLTYKLYSSGYQVDLLTRSKVDRFCWVEDSDVIGFKPTIYYLDNPPRKRYELVILCVKAYQVDEVIDYIGGLIGGDGYIVTIQNGIGVYENLQDRFGPNRVIAAVSTYGSTRLGPCNARLGGEGVFYIGGDERGVDKLSRLLQGAGLNVRKEENIDGVRWWKTIVNAGINPVTTIFRGPNKVVLEVPEAYTLAHEAVEEGVILAEEMGVKLPEDPHKSLDEVAEATRDNISSMLQDALRGSNTEIDYINGAIVKYSIEYGLDAPVNRVLYHIVKGMVRWRVGEPY